MFDVNSTDVNRGIAVAVLTRPDCSTRVRGAEVAALTVELNERLRWEVDLPTALAVLMIQLCDKGARLTADALGRDFYLDVAVICAARVARRYDASLDVLAARNGLPHAHARPDRQVALPALVDSWLHRGGGAAAHTGVQPRPKLPDWGRERARAAAPVVVVGAGAARVRAFVATPLTRIDQDDHDILLAIARAVQRDLEARGFHVIVPGLFLSPNISDDNNLDERYERERRLITGADLVVVVGAETDSWGLSKTVTWAELGGAPVIMLGRETQPWCRVLGGGPYRLHQDLIDTPEDLTASVETALVNLGHFAHLHAAERLAIASAMQAPLDQARRLLDRTLSGTEIDQTSMLTTGRARSILASATSFATASVAELRELQSLVGTEAVGELLHASVAFGRQSGDEIAALTRRRVLGSAQFQALLSGRQMRRWSDAEVLQLLSDYFAADGRIGRAALTRSGSLGDWVARAERLLHRRGQ